jgi:hypothetical protein
MIMENLYTKLEQLLKDFSNRFLKELICSEDYSLNGEVSKQFETAYFDYMNHFAMIQKDIENFSPNNQSESREQKRALHLLRKSSGVIFNTFALG